MLSLPVINGITTSGTTSRRKKLTWKTANHAPSRANSNLHRRIDFNGRSARAARGGAASRRLLSATGAAGPPAIRDVLGDYPEAPHRAAAVVVEPPHIHAGNGQWLAPVGAFVAGDDDGFRTADDELFNVHHRMVGPGAVP